MNFNSVCIESLKNMGVQLTYFSSSNLHIWIIHAALVFTGKYTYNTTTTIQQRQKYFSHTRTDRQTHIHGQWHANNKHIQFCQEEAIKCSMPVKRAKAKEHTKRNGQLKSAEFYFFDCASKAAWIQQCSMYLPILWNAKKNGDDIAAKEWTEPHSRYLVISTENRHISHHTRIAKYTVCHNLSRTLDWTKCDSNGPDLCTKDYVRTAAQKRQIMQSKLAD